MCPPPMGQCRWQHPAVLGHKTSCEAHGLAENCSSPAGMGQEDRVWWWKGPSTCSSPEHHRAGAATPTPRCPMSPPGARGSASSKRTARYCINMQQCPFINALLSFWVNRTPSPSRQTVAVCGVAEPILAHCAQGCAINLRLKACLLLLLLPPLTERGGANSHERKRIPSAFVEIQTVHYEIKAGNEAMGRGESLLSLIT